MLLFQKRFLAGLVDGSITLAFRQWSHARVKPGGRYRAHPIGVVAVDKIDRVRVEEITDRDARRAGFADLVELLQYLGDFHAHKSTADESPSRSRARPSKSPSSKSREEFGPETELFRIELHHAGDGDWVPISRDDQLSADDVAEIDRRLARFDAKQPWTRATLTIIERRPRTAASRLAAELERETAPFKADVVKLKKLGLTQSFEVGYELSPRGLAYWNLAKRRK